MVDKLRREGKIHSGNLEKSAGSDFWLSILESPSLECDKTIRQLEDEYTNQGEKN